jgi:predicted AlkP superfamily pyrophosphatase or phosphodiesterase
MTPRTSASILLLLFAIASAILLPVRAGAQDEPDPLFFGAYDRAREKTVSARPAPKLAVLMIFDQVRAGYLDRLLTVTGRDGFQRLHESGAVFTDCRIEYCRPFTGPGHSTIATGANPWRHGIIGNGWFDQNQGRGVNCVEDRTVHPVGGSEGQPCSPWRQEAPTVADMLRSDTRGVGKVIAVGGKDRSAVLTAGRRPNGAYWPDPSTGRMYTSSYYESKLPGWVERANQEMDPATALEEPWEMLLSPEAYFGTVPANGVNGFPHRIDTTARDGGFSQLRGTPFGLEQVFHFASSAVLGEGLGKDAVCDLLVVGVSAPDAVGHSYGPDSPEYFDICARADREVAGFLKFLDREIGSGEYVLILTADHGVATTAAYAEYFEAGPRDSIGGAPVEELTAWFDRAFDQHFSIPEGDRPGRWLKTINGGFLTFDLEWLSERGLSVEEVAKAAVDSAAANPWLIGAYSPYDPRPGAGPVSYTEMARKSWYPGRSGHVVLLPEPLVLFGRSDPRHTSHYSPYLYDTQVPLILWGWGVREGLYRETVSLVDIAPTLATLMGIRVPYMTEGTTLTRALRLPPAPWDPPER